MKKEALNYLFITLGCSLMALGLVGFLSPNDIATGGIAGLSIILHSLFNIPMGLVFGLMNVPLLLVSIKYLGKYFAIKSSVAIVLIGLFIDVLAKVVHLEALSTEPLLATLYGGVVIGAGLGFIFKGGGSAGGGTIIARIVTSKTSLKTSTVILFLDIMVIMVAGIVFSSIELALWSMISIFTAAKMIDTILTGRPNEIIVHISSFKPLAPLGLLIKQKIGVSGTTVNGKDMAQKEDKDIIFVVVPKNRLNSLENIVSGYDDRAKMIVMEATQMVGAVNSAV